MQLNAIWLSFLLGFVPMFAFAYAVYWTDRYEKEPVVMLLGVFLWGAIIAAGTAFVVNTFLGLGVYLFTASEAFTELSTGSAIAPLIEESLKGMAVLLVFLFFRREFDSLLDGIVYAAITAIGFAATENVYYLYTYGFLEDGVSGIWWVFFVRVILVGWQHPFYTSFIGIGLAVTRLSRSSFIKVAAPLLGWGAAVFTHSVHNTISTLYQNQVGFVLGLLLDWSGWIVMAVFILWALYREQCWITSQLKEEVTSGLITPAQYQTACSAWAQSRARMGAILSKRYRQVNRFYLLTAELAYKKEQVATLNEPEPYRAEIDRLRVEIKNITPQLQAG